MDNTDRIEKQIVIRAPRSRVWQALTDSAQFGAWFRVALEGPFEAGTEVHGKMTYPGYEGLPFKARVERIEPEDYFSYSWPPSGGKIDRPNEPWTLVEFRLADAEEGTLLTVIETGFDNLSPELRASELAAHTGGWETQLGNIRSYVEG